MGTKENNSTTSFNKRALNEKRKVFGVEFAPINVPWERRKQTLATLGWICLFFVSGPFGIPILLYVFFCTRFWILSLLYLAFVYYDRETCNVGGRKRTWVRNWLLWRYYRQYFPMKLIKTAELDPKRNYLLTSHPHGILASGTFCNFATEGNDVSKIFPGMTWHLLTLPLNFWLPFYRELALEMGLCSSKKESMNHLLNHPGGGKGVVLVPGGASESLESHPGSYVVELKNKKGFIKVALQNGSHLVPVFCFGETDIYGQVKNPKGSLIRSVQEKVMQMLSFAPLLFIGRGVFQYSFGVLPRRHPIYVVVGSPIEVEKVNNPSQEQIDSLHAKYTKALQTIFDMYKGQYAKPGAELKLI